MLVCRHCMKDACWYLELLGILTVLGDIVVLDELVVLEVSGGPIEPRALGALGEHYLERRVSWICCESFGRACEYFIRHGCLHSVTF